MRHLLVCWLTFCCGSVLAADEHERRLAAELLVLGGDVRRLVVETLPPLERAGLEQRVAGALSSLPLLLRRAGLAGTEAVPLRTAYARHDWRALLAATVTLQQHSPFDSRRLIDTPTSPAILALGAALHRTTCAGCHDAPPQADMRLPAQNLAAQIKRMPRAEFAARLWLGIRGDKTSAYANPFDDRELAALIAYYGREPATKSNPSE